MNKIGAAFNDIGLFDFKLYTPMGNYKAENLGPDDVTISATPGNEGNVFNIVEGSSGQMFFNKSYRVKNWNVTIRVLRNTPDYTKLTHLVQEVLRGNVTLIGLEIRNRTFGDPDSAGTINSLNESLVSQQAALVNFAGIEAGANIDGSFELNFKCSDAEYSSGAYIAWGATKVAEDIEDSGGSIHNTGSVDDYTNVTKI